MDTKYMLTRSTPTPVPGRRPELKRRAVLAE